MLALLCDWFEKLTDYIFGLDSSAFVQSPLWCFYYLIFDPQSLTYFLSKCSLCSHWQPGCTGHYQIIANYLCPREQRWQICGVFKKLTFSLATFSSLTTCRSLFYKSCFTWLSLQGPSLVHSCNKTTELQRQRKSLS